VAYGPEDRLSLYRGWAMGGGDRDILALRERIAALADPVAVRVAGPR
jgi:hypothetical protein